MPYTTYIIYYYVSNLKPIILPKYYSFNSNPFYLHLVSSKDVQKYIFSDILNINNITYYFFTNKNTQVARYTKSI